MNECFFLFECLAFIERIAIREERPPMHTYIPQRLQDLIRRCWAQDPNDRYSQM
jgi:hypothetical protein